MVFFLKTCSFWSHRCMFPSIWLRLTNSKGVSLREKREEGWGVQNGPQRGCRCFAWRVRSCTWHRCQRCKCRSWRDCLWRRHGRLKTPTIYTLFLLQVRVFLQPMYITNYIVSILWYTCKTSCFEKTNVKNDVFCQVCYVAQNKHHVFAQTICKTWCFDEFM